MVHLKVKDPVNTKRSSLACVQVCIIEKLLWKKRMYTAPQLFLSFSSMSINQASIISLWEFKFAVLVVIHTITMYHLSVGRFNFLLSP